MTHPGKYLLPGLFFTLSILGGNIGCGWSQISSTWADYSDTIEYPVFDGNDLYYIFYSPLESSRQTYGRLHADPPAGSIPGWNFEWSRYDTVSKSFAAPFLTQTGVPSSEVTDLESGGYCVRITGPDTDTTFRAWVFRNSPVVDVLKDTATGQLKKGKYTCDFIKLNGTLIPEEHIYYDLSSDERLSIPNGMTFKWTADNENVKIPSPSYFLDPRLETDLPTVDTWFILTAVDSFRMAQDDSVFYETIHTRAEFKIKIEDEDNEGVWIEPAENKGEAPLVVRFINISENGSEFQWAFVDSAKTGPGSETTTYLVEDSVEFTYYIPNYYFPKLVSFSEYCVDSFPNSLQNETPIEIQVEPSKLDIMNVFTPNGDDINDVFVVDAKSLKDFKISIYNRWGRLVYEHIQTEDKWDWEGWDGTIHGKGNRKAEPGVYFYVIEAIGWDAKVYRKGVYRGFVYLIMDKESL